MCTTFERKNDIGQAFHSRVYMNISNPPIYSHYILDQTL